MYRAQCSCSQLSLDLAGEPIAVVVCHCLQCQRRTGSTFGVGAYFAADLVRFLGDASTHTRPTDSGRTLTNHFCPGCGSTVYWRTDKYPQMIGVAFGAITDPKLLSPQRSVWEQSRCSWVSVEGELLHFERGTPQR